ncbi:hypothetical protein LJB76_01910 [Clostridia bacterium OttesenSCG-928-O13]|nr:hypothetical protein [Clostridia bacterium OttesenSCG-928-O13]
MTMIKQKGIRLVAMALAVLMLAAAAVCLVPATVHAAEAEPATAQPTMEEAPWAPLFENPKNAYEKEFLARGEDFTAGEDGAILALNWLIQGMGGKIQTELWGKVWSAIFGPKEDSAVVTRLKYLEEAMKNLTNDLGNIANLIEEKFAEKEINEKLNVMSMLEKSVDHPWEEFGIAKTLDGKYKVLDDWYNKPPAGYSTVFQMIDDYTDKIQDHNTGANNIRTGYFSKYDNYAYLAYNWEMEGLYFRQSQREADILLVSKMIGLAKLWLQKELAKKLTDDQRHILESRQKNLTVYAQRVVDAYNKRPVQTDKNFRKFHYQKTSFEVAVPNGTFNMKTYLDRILHKGISTHKARGTMQEFVGSTRRTDGGERLMNKKEIDTIVLAAKNAPVDGKRKGISPLRYIEGNGKLTLSAYRIALGTWGPLQPVDFSDWHGPPGEKYRNMYFEFANFTREDMFYSFGEELCTVNCETFDSDVFEEHTFNKGKPYAVLRGDYTSQGMPGMFKDVYYVNDEYGTLWIKNSTNLVGYEPQQRAEHNETSLVQGTIESLGDGVLALKAEDGKTYNITFDEKTDMPSTALAVGQRAAVEFKEFDTADGKLDHFYAVNIRLLDEEPPGPILYATGEIQTLDGGGMTLATMEGDTLELVLDESTAIDGPPGAQPQVGDTVSVGYQQKAMPGGTVLVAVSITLHQGPIPGPVPNPTPDPEPDPTPGPVPNPDPGPTPEPDPAPDPVPNPTPDSEPDPVPGPAEDELPVA